jgi:hypothetical protein
LTQKDRALGLRVVNTGTGQRMAFNSETGQYDIPVGKPKPAGGGGSAGGIAGSGLTQEAVDSAARRYHETGEMIPAGQGKSGTAIKTVILNRAAELFPGDSVGGNKGDYKANAKSLTEAQSSFDAVNTFERTAIKNLDLMTRLAKKIPDWGSSWLNKPVRSLAGAMGGEDMVAFNTALNAVRPEFNKILEGKVKGSAGLSEGARHEMATLMNEDMTVGQLLAAADVLKQDTENRKSSAQEVLKNIRARLRGQKTDEDAPDKTPATASGATVAVRRKSDKVTKLLSPDAAKRAVAEHPDMYELVQ